MVCYPEPSGKAPLGTGTSCKSVTGPLQRSEQQQNSQSANILRLFWLHVAAKVEPRFTSSAGRAVSVLKTRLHSEREQHRVSNGPGHDALYYESLLRRWIFLQPLVWGVVGDVWVLRVRTRRSADTTEPLVSLRCENTQRRFKCRLFYIIKNKTTYCGSLGWISRAEWLRGNQ